MNLKDHEANFAPFHNHVCLLYSMKVVRLVGVAEDASDFYYVVREIGRGEYWASAVGHISSLRGKLDEGEYERADNLLSLNGAGPTDGFAAISEPDPELGTS